MAKNKNRERKQPQTGRAQQTAQHPSAEPQAEPYGSKITSGDVARKGREKRFGHN